MAIIDNLSVAYELADVNDSHSGALHLTNNNTVVFAAGGAVFVGASSQFLSRASSAALQAGDRDFFWQVRAKSADTAVTDAIVSKDSATSGQREYLLYFISSERIRFAVFKATDTAVEAISTVATVDDTYYLIQGWHNAALDTVNISVNGETFVAQATGGALQAASSAPLYLGGRSNSGSELFLDGGIEQAYYWLRIPDATERAWLNNSNSGRTYAELVTGIPASVIYTQLERGTRGVNRGIMIGV